MFSKQQNWESKHCVFSLTIAYRTQTESIFVLVNILRLHENLFTFLKKWGSSTQPTKLFHGCRVLTDNYKARQRYKRDNQV